ncbi:MAG: phosphatase PAP2 family protein [Rhodospirillales bacterium]|nr:phosphatase PAP2 family protein [Rhodospirillales bacterium]MDH3793342.1 phosphatase PAP2 family protein [Rhodospirillales bacterium]MDH3913202.1 phosphatase PAP2 family protein [Rhodospirillales bacterium]MDH3918479.1 phosphatase PAP2 family protein [Rhodospirillales bacterium]MDH3966202.1 phosphatase PAP2 family protein [Rhodospirillales bacterium]
MFKHLTITAFVAAALVHPRPAAAGAAAFETYGDISQYAIPGIAMLFTMARGDPEGLVQLGASTAATFGTVQGVKRAVDRERPGGGGLSFPSGHTSGAFSGASYLHYRYGWEYGLPAYLAAAAVGYSRVEADKHYWSDVAVGAAIANLSAFLLDDPINERITVLPMLDIRKPSFGIVASIRF